jgi:hypothetical protein
MQAHAELNNPLAFTPSTIPASRLQLLTGRALTGLVALFLLFDGAVKLVPPQAVIDISQQLGYSGDTMFGIGLLLLACLGTYLIPQTATLGALLLTAYLGGAVATHVRVGSPTFSILFPALVAAMIWGGLLLRKPSLRVLLPFRSAGTPNR